MTLTVRLWFEEINLVDGLGSQLHHFAKFRLGGAKERAGHVPVFSLF